MENTGNNVQIKVNTYNRLKKIRSGVVYESITTVIDELLQNCYRSFMVSKTENPVIDITIEDDYFIVRDNGSGCVDPQDIFEFEKSGWDISDAFGQGGSESIFQISDYIEMRSRYWQAKVDVLNILETENMLVDVFVQEDDYQGFEVTLKGEHIKENIALLKTYFESTLCFYSCNSYINGQLVKKTNLHDFKSAYKMTFDNPFYKATLGVQKGWMDVQVYYENRKVCDIWQTGVYGVIELKRDAVNLKAPDRKAIINDTKYSKFRECLKDDGKILYIEFIQESGGKAFDEYEYQIDNVLTPQDYADFLPYYNKLEYDRVRTKVLAEEVPSKKTVTQLESNESKVHSVSSDSVFVPEEIEVDREYPTPEKIEKGEFRKKLGKILNIVWCEFERKEELQDLINQAEQYNIDVIYSKNKLYGKAFEYWGIPHIEKIMAKHEAKFIISKPSGYDALRGVTRKEERLLNVLNVISEFYGLSDVFRIADVSEHLKLEHDGEVVMDAVIKTSAAPIKDRQKIYLDRSTLNLGKVNISESKSSVTKFDVLIVMLNIGTIASGLAQLLYNTIDKTVDHYSKVDKISKEIALLLASL